MLVVAEAESAEDARHAVVQATPDILLLDICIPGGGIEAARAIQQSASPVKVVMLTAAEDDEHVSEGIEAGAKGYVLKGVSGFDLIWAVECVHSRAGRADRG
jgi:two-component system nitrate/nitrite response regulator NarL